jgi:hypothetical protein
MPQNRTPRCLELTRAALALTDDILEQARARIAPAMEAGIADHVWDLAELLA